MLSFVISPGLSIRDQ